MAGYIGPQPVPQATQNRETFTATASQTIFNTGGYTPGYIDVFLNGVKLVDTTDYTATNGSDVILTSGAAASDTLEVVAYTAFTVADQDFTGQISFEDGTAAAPSITNTGDTDTGIFFPAADTIGFAEGGVEAARIDASGNLLVGKTSADNGATVGVELRGDISKLYVTDSDSSPLIANRLASDGNIAVFQKDGTTVGSIGTEGSDICIFGSATDHVGLRMALNTILPMKNGTITDAAVDLGQASANYRFKDLYLSGGVYLGGTGASNQLDDYEEGTWTVTTNVGTITNNMGFYRKVGDLVYATAIVGNFSDITSSTEIQLSLPFTSSSSSINNHGSVMSRFIGISGESLTSFIADNSPFVNIYRNGTNSNNWSTLTYSDLTSTSAYLRFSISYMV